MKFKILMFVHTLFRMDIVPLAKPKASRVPSSFQEQEHTRELTLYFCH
jgi:hypothetical protein